MRRMGTRLPRYPILISPTLMSPEKPDAGMARMFTEQGGMTLHNSELHITLSAAGSYSCRQFIPLHATKTASSFGADTKPYLLTRTATFSKYYAISTETLYGQALARIYRTISIAVTMGISPLQRNGIGWKRIYCCPCFVKKRDSCCLETRHRKFTERCGHIPCSLTVPSNACCCRATFFDM